MIAISIQANSNHRAATVLHSIMFLLITPAALVVAH